MCACVLFEHATIGSGSRDPFLHCINLYENTAVTFASVTFSCYSSLFRFLPPFSSSLPLGPPQSIHHLDKSVSAPPSRSCTRARLSLSGIFLPPWNICPFTNKDPAYNSNEGNRWRGGGGKHKGREEVDLHKRERDARYHRNPFPFSSLWANTPGCKKKKEDGRPVRKTNLFISWIF